MKKMSPVLVLVAAVASLAAPLAAVELAAPSCRDIVDSAVDLTDPATAWKVGLEVAGEPASEPVPLLVPVESAQPEQCGNRVCTPGTSCCNPLCSICTPPGVGCTLEDCGDG